MANRNTEGSKDRILFLEHYFLEHTDEQHPLTTEELLSVCREKGFRANRNTIADDIASLRDSGWDIIMEPISRNHARTNAYFVGARLFEQAEIKLLVDAVSSSRFITEEKSNALVEKLAHLTNSENRPRLVSHTFISDRIKTNNYNIMVYIDTIHQAISDHKKVTFQYWDYTARKQKVLRHGGELYTASPFALVWNDDRYYMAAFSDKRKKVVSYRVDRMYDLQMTSEPAVIDESFNPADYTRKVINMFDGGRRPCRVTLLCENAYMQNIIDRFGEDTKTAVADDEHFQAAVTVCPSNTFFRWVVQFHGAILIQKPLEVKADFEALLRKVLQEQERPGNE